ncbi:FGGY-family carbohydrate kinase [Frigidibacter sp. ROC022]|uniref:FGGY-family carbohydrate kinase n=1 Tax=Frigidibacter sp. ROC022 TaxID=2971796 RepID=UPI00215A3BFA|nr:FGGY family carbohydrate kinase [Frigidibacter sp. ROC022]MCR8726132.1 FGGY family carbohydrate kinase [Frigidibacter sp. ROC022]
MGSPCILAIDQGTTNSKALLVSADGTVLARASAPLASDYPAPGWAQQSALEIWQSVQTVIADLLRQQPGVEVAGIAIANQRETLVTWDAETGAPAAPAILWQCRRTAEACAALHSGGMNPVVEAATGLAINPLFPASKLAWVVREVPEAAALLQAGKLRAGTVDSWLLWNLTGGKSFATDHSNASRTQLFNTETLEWDAELGRIFGAPLEVLPRPMASDSRFGETDEDACALPAGVPILAMLGDSHAALYGHGVRGPGIVKATYGTGSSLMTLTPERIASRHGLSGTIAWTTRAGTAHAIEGNITVSAQAAAYMATMMGLDDARALSDLAETVPDSGGVTFVPALAGLGAPHWNDRATGSVEGLTLGSKPAHLARATFEAIALQVADVFTAMERDIGRTLDELRADGGASANPFLMQLQADLLDRRVLRRDLAEIGAMGAAAMAFETIGHALSPDPDTHEDRFDPRAPENRSAILEQWQAAIRRALRA